MTGKPKYLLSAIAAIAVALLPQAAMAAATTDAFATAARLHRGVNVLGYDPLWTNPARARFQPRHFAIIRKGGFDFIRLVLQSFDHMDAANRLDPTWLATLDRVIHQATEAGLSVIVDEHDFEKCSDDPDRCEPRLQAFWQQIGERYRTAPDSVLFELLNEPHGKLDADRLNAMIAHLLPVIRATNPGRTLVIGPTNWNSLAKLPELKLPENDRNILVTFHYYEPFHFTHQGASWAGAAKDLHGIPFTPADAVRIRHRFRHRRCLEQGERAARPARRVRRLRQERHADRGPRPLHRHRPPGGGGASIPLGLLAVRRRFHRLRYRT